MALFGYVTMLLWNALMPLIFSVTSITFWQAVGLLVLARLIFGGLGHHRSKDWNSHRNDYVMRNKIAKMSPEEKKEFFRKMHYERAAWHRGHSKENVVDHDHLDEEQNGK